MTTYTSHDGRKVQADSPAQAMLKLWGPPKRLQQPQPNTSPKRYTVIGRNGYTGQGLR